MKSVRARNSRYASGGTGGSPGVFDSQDTGGPSVLLSLVAVALLMLSCCLQLEAGEEWPPPGVPAPRGTLVKVPIARDTWFSNVGKEAQGGNGGSPRMKLKSIQEMSLFDINPTSLKGHVITGATLHVRLAGAEVLRRITVSTFAEPWVEGSGVNYAPDPGVSSYDYRQNPATPWAYPGSDLNAVMLSQGGTIWRMADAFAPDANRWQKVAVDPSVVAARVAGVSSGFLLFDDTGSEWSVEGDRFIFRMFPNRMIFSKDSNSASAPYLEVYLGPADNQPPAAPYDFKSDVSDLPAGEAMVSWITPADAGQAGTIGFFVEVDGKPVPRYLIPPAGKPGQRVSMHLRDLPLAPGQRVAISVKSVDGAGNIGPAGQASVQVSSETDAPLPGANAKPLKPATAERPAIGDARIAIIDALDKVQPITGQMIPPEPADYLSANHLWDGKQIRLHAGRNEWVQFQVLAEGKTEHLKARIDFAQSSASARPAAAIHGFRYVKTRNGPLIDPIVELKDGLSVPDPNEHIEGQRFGSLLAEIYVPHDMPPGTREGTLILEAGGKSLRIPISLTVWDFTLPDSLSFLPEMNCYGLPGNEKDYYRLAELNRTVINRVPYHHSGDVDPGCAPEWNPKTRKLDWTKWDKRFGPLLDGSAFKDQPRGATPLELMYLPLFENWPTPMKGNYNGNYWADQAFPARYRDNFIEVSRQFAEHFNQKRWDQTLFQCFFNGKNNFKAHGWSRATSPWLLDEPANFQDYWALRYFGELFHRGLNLAPGPAKMLFRADISRPEWQRNALDHVLDYNVVGGGAFRKYDRMVLDRKRAFGEIVIPYGTSNNPADSNVQPAAWCLDSWTTGGDGVLPWQVIGGENSWKNADDLSLFYPGDPIGQKEPVPSIRLKSYLRGEQDVEYLTLLAKVEHQSRAQLARRVRTALKLPGQKHGTGFGGEDAGIIDFGRLTPGELWAFRVRVGEILSAAHPAAQRKLVDFHTPRRDPEGGAPGYVSVGEVPSAKHH